MKKLDRFRGSLLGLAACDAVGTALELQPPGSFTPIDGMVEADPFTWRRANGLMTQSRTTRSRDMSWGFVPNVPHDVSGNSGILQENLSDSGYTQPINGK